MNILVLIAALLVALNAHNHYTCIFEKINRDVREESMKAKPDVSSVPHGSKRMLLTITRNPIRITLDYSNFTTLKTPLNGASATTTTNLDFVLNAMKVAVAFYMSRLQVYPLTTISAPSTCFDYNTPPNDQQYGISASDLHIYTTYITDASASYGATGKSCKYYGDGTATLPDATLQVGRPTMGRIIFNTYSLVDTQSSLTNRLFQSIVSTACHEVLHILGMDSTLYGSWLDSDENSANFGNAYTSTTQSATAYITSSRPTKASTLFLTTPNVKAWARTFFGCTTLPGMMLQNEDGSGLGGGSHWQRLAMYDQMMTGTALGAVKYFSALTFSALRDMGWYTVDATFNETSNYGYQKGCDFVYNACYSSTSYDQFCDAATQSSISVCQTSFYSKAICSSQTSLMADGCGLYGPYFNCVDPASQNDGYQSYTRQVYSTTSFCVKSTLGTVALPNTVQSRCYPYVCNSDNIVFTVGTNTITCLSSEGGVQKTISAFTGYLQCPDFNSFCTYSRKTCPNWCSQNGYCMGGVCNCMSGYYGDDCSKTICSSGLFYNTLSSSCVSTCPSGYYANSYNTACMKCASACQQCFGESTICTGCISSSTNPQYYYNNTCHSQCPSGTYTSGFNCSLCDSTVFCATCDVVATNCTSCSGGKFLSQPVFGTCQVSCPATGTYSVTDMVNYVCVSTCSSNLVLINTGGINTCQYCPGSTYKFTSNSSCVTACPDFYYPNNTIWLCSRCDSSCLTCNGGYAENCTSCSPTATLRYLLLKMCWSVCPGGYYSNDTACACQICPSGLNCGNCTYQNSSQSIICTSCAYGYFYQSSTSTCQSGCDPDQFANLGNNSCITCDSSCLTCVGPGSSSCSSCTSPLLYVSNVTGGYCISGCPAVGYFSTMPGSNTCVACDLTCLNCSGSTASSCTACFNGSYLNSGYCRYVCPPAKYPDTNLRVCSGCDGSCTFCFGPTINECTGCISGMVLYNFTCTLSCPTGYTVNQWSVCFESLAHVGLVIILFLTVAIL